MHYEIDIEKDLGPDFVQLAQDAEDQIKEGLGLLGFEEQTGHRFLRSSQSELFIVMEAVKEAAQLRLSPVSTYIATYYQRIKELDDNDVPDEYDYIRMWCPRPDGGLRAAKELLNQSLEHNSSLWRVREYAHQADYLCQTPEDEAWLRARADNYGTGFVQIRDGSQPSHVSYWVRPCLDLRRVGIEDLIGHHD